MRAKITTKSLQNLQPRDKAYFLRSSDLRGFAIKINPSGSIKYIVETKFKGSSYRKTIGTFPLMSLKDAQKGALNYLQLTQSEKYKRKDKASPPLISLGWCCNWTSWSSNEPNLCRPLASLLTNRYYTVLQVARLFIKNDISNWAKSHIFSGTLVLASIVFLLLKMQGAVIMQLLKVTLQKTRGTLNLSRLIRWLAMSKTSIHGNYFSLTEIEKRDADRLVVVLRKRIAENDSTITGFNVGMNCGESAGQTILHCHIHWTPWRCGDTPNPRGGVRGVIPVKIGVLTVEYKVVKFTDGANIVRWMRNLINEQDSNEFLFLVVNLYTIVC